MRKCDGVRGRPDCNNEVVWKVSGNVARFGVPLTQYMCNECKEYIEKHPTPKILEYNRFIPTFTRLEASKE